ncbi:hypothetical protein PISMIDRAFT_19667 [Pisolithus microcarpus 441]|uniref:Uncharacterized protein n=1 Tax=Pisolithus microcarpus 441 TaxID=765257 RepID=A0A0C9YLU3_9AGAM|nr:hypothetical protein BKA83DRAFT_19667 [Pisolithus microcarpus]KIK11272.1 hypothetical protein PISMIDRAFT_19667 [Pisolithus microcarpus 441]
MFEAASKIKFGLDSPFGTSELREYDLYDLVDKQKRVKIDSFEALLDYQLCFTKVVTCLQVTNQLSSIEKDNLYLEGFD